MRNDEDRVRESVVEHISEIIYMVDDGNSPEIVENIEKEKALLLSDIEDILSKDQEQVGIFRNARLGNIPYEQHMAVRLGEFMRDYALSKHYHDQFSYDMESLKKSIIEALESLDMMEVLTGFSGGNVKPGTDMGSVATCFQCGRTVKDFRVIDHLYLDSEGNEYGKPTPFCKDCLGEK